MGKHDRRNSLKMKRRKGQVKKKARLKRHSLERKATAAAGAKKPTPSKRAARSTSAPAQPATE